MTDVKENREIALAMEEAKRVGKKIAMATVVRVKGSAYRREGAKMLIDEEGNMTGVISGGCLEPDVVEVAKQVMADGRPVLKSYDLDEDFVWGLGLGCPGTVDVLIEPVSRNWTTNDAYALSNHPPKGMQKGEVSRERRHPHERTEGKRSS
jgi:xanthine dehydrogenase accessory factor